MKMHARCAAAKTGRRNFVTFAALLSAIAAAQAQTPPLNPPHNPRVDQLIQNLGKEEMIREVNLSPDGKDIVWSETGHAGYGIQLATLADPASPRHITACAEGRHAMESEAAFSPDSSKLAFFSDCTPDHKTAIFLADVSGSAAPHQFIELNGVAQSLEWSPDGKYLSIIYVEGATRQPSPLAAEKPPAGVIGVEGLEIKRIALIDATNGELNQITPSDLYVYEYSWSKDSSKLAYIAAPPPGENNWWVAKLYTQPLNGHPTAILDTQTVPGPLHGLQIAVPRWSPDGTRIAFIGGLMSDQGSTGGDVWTVPATGGDPVNLTAGRHETATWLQWGAPGELYYSAISGGLSQLRRLDTHSGSDGSYRSNVDFQLPAAIGSGQLQGSLSIARGTIAFIKSSFSEAPEVWYARDVGAECAARDPNDCYQFTQVTHLNDDLKPMWGQAKSIDWTNEGFHVQGWLLLPAHYDPAKKYPMVVYVHGGPSSAEMTRWPRAGYGPVPLSAMDYFVLMPNPRGSYGQGETFTQANRKDFGYGDLRDILAGVDAVEKQYPIDNHRIGITGWSYGGFMTMFAVTQTHRFRAAVSGAGLSDWLSYYGENSIDQWMIPFFGSSVYENPKVYAKSSAINFITNVKTPTLVVVGDRDGECPAPQSFEFWHALHDLGVTTQFVVYPNEGHGFVNPEHRRDVLERAIAWFDLYMPPETGSQQTAQGQ